MTTDEFEEFWGIYPRRVAKLAALKAFTKARKIASLDDILAGARRYAAERANEDQQFTAHPASWLNAGRWMDEPAQPKQQGILESRKQQLRQRILNDEQGHGRQGGGDLEDAGLLPFFAPDRRVH